MKLPTLSDSIKGLLLIVGGCIILFDTLGFTTQLLHSIVLFGAIFMIIIGAFMVDIHKKVYRLLTKKKEEPPQPPQW